MKMKYVTVLSVDSTIFSSYTFRANSIADPDVTGAGSRPMGYDQMAALYGRYLVGASKVSIRCTSDFGDNSFVAILPDLDATGPSNWQSFTEQAFVRQRMLSVQNGNIAHLSNFMSTKKLFGTSIQDRNFSSNFPSGPTILWYWHVSTRPFDLGEDCRIDMEITLTYYVKMYERKSIGRSIIP